jgi:hypothetical protein
VPSRQLLDGLVQAGTGEEPVGEAGLAAAWAEGRALSPVEAIEEALAEGE